MDDTCKLHGKVEYIFVKLAEAKLCLDCVKAGYYRKDIEVEMKTTHPHLFEEIS